MSGLLATLIQAAQGRATVATPRPNARFEQADATAADIERRARTEQETEVGTAEPMADTQTSASAAPESQATPAPAPRQTAPAPLLPPPNDAATALPKQDPIAPRASQVEAAETTNDDGRDAGSMAEKGTFLPPSEPKPAEIAPRPDAAPRFDALLPPQEPTTAQAAPMAALEVTQAERNETVMRSESGFTLRIGRIEVRQPAEQPAQASRPVVRTATRPVSLPRASVRQSLDDYRASRKR